MSRRILIGIASSSIIALALALIFGALSPWISAISLLVGVGSAVVGENEPQKGVLRSPLEYAILGFLGFTVLFHSLYLVYELDGQVMTLHRNNFGDLGLHVGMIRFLSECDFWPANPIFWGDDLDYPFGMNMWNALWESLGVPTYIHLRWTMLVMSAVLIAVLWRLGGVFFLLYFFFSASSLSYLPGDGEIHLKNFFLSLWITQRGFLWALPMGLFLLRDLKGVFEGQSWGSGSRVLLGLMAFFHLHSFVFFVLSFAAAIAVGALRGHRSAWELRALLVPGLLGLPFVLNSTDGLQKASVAHWDWAWMIDGFGEFFRNFGPWPLIFLISAYLLKERRHVIVFYLISFLLFFNLMLAPWAWDNIKVLIWPLLGLGMVLAREVEKSFKSDRQRDLALIVALIVMAPGIREVYLSWPLHKPAVGIVDVASLNDWKQILQPIDANTPVVIYPIYNHPVSFLGQQVVMGYDGHLWSYGIDYKQVRNDIDGVYLGPVHESLSGVRYYAFGKKEQQGFKIQELGLASSQVLKSGGEQLYVVDSLGQPDSGSSRSR